MRHCEVSLQVPQLCVVHPESLCLPSYVNSCFQHHSSVWSTASVWILICTLLLTLDLSLTCHVLCEAVSCFVSSLAELFQVSGLCSCPVPTGVYQDWRVGADLATEGQDSCPAGPTEWGAEGTNDACVWFQGIIIGIIQYTVLRLRHVVHRSTGNRSLWQNTASVTHILYICIFILCRKCAPSFGPKSMIALQCIQHCWFIVLAPLRSLIGMKFSWKYLARIRCSLHEWCIQLALYKGSSI